ncbi:MAG: hypothetical protein JOZ69_20010 [Myxococcales bacterium]|nr:hypothetical protein [Myxococcales bacterium]
MVRSAPSRVRSRRVAVVELAVGFSLVGSLLAVAVPTFVREVHASRLVEPADGLKRLGASAVAYGQAHRDLSPAPGAQATAGAAFFPASAALTPSQPPRGKCEVDPPGTWDGPTWTALAFRPAPPDVPHCFAFAFDSAASPGLATFRAHAHADLDGDGIPSTFEVTGRAVSGDPRGAVLDPGMFVESEAE